MPRLFPTTELSTARVDVTRVDDDVRPATDAVAVEEPLEIRVGTQSISITMRTPGDDPELAAGLLFAEGLLKTRDDLSSIRHCGPSGADRLCNTIRVDLAPGVSVDLSRAKRHFFTSSACGVCGKNSIEALKFDAPNPLPEARVSAATIRALPSALREAQPAFEQTGGLHAAGLFTTAGELVELREDVGRHNAVDKVIGARFLARRIPAGESILMVSGRASYELVQKAIVAGIPILAAVGAPSSLAVSLAREFRLTLVGFLRRERFNIYSSEDRIVP